MASFAPTARAVEAPARLPAERPVERKRARRPSKAEQRRLAGSAVWIGVVAMLLAGIVAVNVAALQLNLRLDDLTRERARLRADNAAVAAKLASAAAAMRIQQHAQAELGLVPAREGETTYVDLARGG